MKPKRSSSGGQPASRLVPKKVRPRGGRPRKGDDDLITASILAVAGELFAANGLAATSLDLVASTSGVARDTIYRRYSSKEELFKAVAENARQQILAGIDFGPVPAGDTLEALRSISFQLLTAHVDPVIVATRRIMMTEAMKRSDMFSTIAGDPLRERLVELVAEAQDAKLLREGDKEFLAMQLFSAVAARPSIDTLMGSKQYATVEARREYFDKAWDLFCQGAVSK